MLDGVWLGLQVSGGELLVVVGSVGAGKSSLLSAMLGEMQLQQVCSQGVGCWGLTLNAWLSAPIGLDYIRGNGSLLAQKACVTHVAHLNLAQCATRL